MSSLILVCHFSLAQFRSASPPSGTERGLHEMLANYQSEDFRSKAGRIWGLLFPID
jgi:hypothetical protein